ncbi:MAG: hypothetical protein IKP51_00145 [Treponema sp.]|nr:hypothetical protein [Treponema sp.]
MKSQENIKNLADIFHSQFENPEKSEPYDTHEGGYLNKDSFVDTDYAVQKVFSENPLPEDVRKELVDHLNKESSFWKETDKN